MSFSVATPSPSSAAGSTLPSATVTILTARGSAARDGGDRLVEAAVRRCRSRLLSTTRSAQAIWSSNTSSIGSSWSSAVSATRWRASASRSAATRPSASAAPSTTATTPSTVTRLLIARPVEGLHQRLRQREPGGLDHDVLDRGPARQDHVERRHEFVRHRAAQAAVGELDDVLFRAGRVAAALEDLAVDADVAELVDDDGEPPAAAHSPARGGSASSCRRPESR